MTKKSVRFIIVIMSIFPAYLAGLIGLGSVFAVSSPADFLVCLTFLSASASWGWFAADTFRMKP